MYNNKETADRIREQAKSKKIKLGTMTQSLNLGINIISQLANGQNIAVMTIASIADYLNCSIDYLLGRTENPEVNKKPPEGDS